MKDLAFWGRVKMLLGAHRLTQKEFAHRIHVPLSTLQRWIHSDIIPGTQFVYNMAVTLGVSSNYLLGGEEKDLEERRLLELAARETLSKVEALAQLILSETAKIKPLN